MAIVKELQQDLQLSEIEEKAFYDESGFNDGLIKPKILTDRDECQLGRVYYGRDQEEQDRINFLSVTTYEQVLNKGYGWDRWLGNSPSYQHAMDYANEKALDGNIVHALTMYMQWGQEIDCNNGFYNMDTGKIVPITDTIKKRLLGFIQYYNDMMPELLATELSLYNPRKYRDRYIYPFAGTADIISRINGKLFLIDIKTGKEYPKNHELQLTAYKILWDSLYGKEHGVIEELACLYLGDGWRKKPTYKLKKYTFNPEAWYNVIDLYNYVNGKKGVLELKFKEDLPNKYSLINKGENEDE